MSDTDSTTPTPSSFATILTHNLAQKLGTMAAAALLTAGLIPQSEVATDGTVLAGVAALAISVLWTVIKSRLDARKQKALAATPGSP